MHSLQSQVTQMLRRWQHGDERALEELMPLVYDQLRRLAGACMKGEKPGHTLRATALVHEAYMRLAGQSLTFNDRAHFYALAARVMRRVLIDHARAQAREKRGGAAGKISLEDAAVISSSAPAALLDLEDALLRLAEFDPRKAHLIEMIYFGGLTYEEAAEVLHVSPVTVHRDLKVAKAWLYSELQQQG